MSILGDFYFFGWLALLAIPAVLLGILEKPIKYYLPIVSIFFIWHAIEDNKTALMYLVGYCLWQMLLIKAYLILNKKFERNAYIYYAALMLSLAPLVIYKLAHFYLGESWLGFLGISYMTFKSVQIIIEIYDRIIKELNVFEFFNFLIFFPAIVSGPIDRSRRFSEDFNNILPREQYLEMVGEGLFKILLGMFYKMVMAASIYQSVVWLGEEDGVKAALIYMYSYGIYLFFDFAGYSLMAVGAAYLFGIKAPDNFNKPFISLDVKEFWDRWHITLSHWLRDFLFSRLMMKAIKGKWFKSKLTMSTVGFMVNMTVMGLWHGLDIYYIIYGVYHGILLSLTEIYQKKSKFHKKHKKETWYKTVSWFITFNLVMFGFFIFSGRLTKILGIV
ncbi:membrane protein involved in D-alanine export [Peptostreptococcaceae bacterium pGA-8]|nr:membrane protein involved in D-alanine export [Peptostreptococcaceae bacterium pGA-8]